jgi:RND family efflux transporter MFP subunit
MKILHRRALTVHAALLLVLALPGCGEARAPEAAAGEEGPPSEVVTLWTPNLELFMEHPLLVAGTDSEPWAIHLTVLDGFQPVRTGRLVLAFTGPDGRTHEFTADAPLRDGIYGPVVELPSSGSYDLTMTYSGAGLEEQIWVGPVFVYASAADFPTVEPEPETGIVLLKEQQWVTPFATAEVGTRRVAGAIPVAGELVAADGGMLAVPAPLAGLVEAGRNAAAPSVGDRVERGQVLATLTSADGDGSWAALVARVEHLRLQAERMERLYAAEAIPERRLIEARHDLNTARRSLEALGAAADSGALLRVRSPVAGVVLERYLVPGARVEAGTALFTVGAAGPLWVRFRVPAVMASRLPEVTGASFRVEGSEEILQAGRRTATSQVIDAQTRSLSLMFEAPKAAAGLRIGMLLQGHLRLEGGEEGVAVPASAVRMEDGIPVAYVQVGGELFQRRVLTLGPGDGEWFRVLAGVNAGERVVTLGAYQVRLASLNPAAVSDHGHPH